jgi:hypothetical protein
MLMSRNYVIKELEEKLEDQERDYLQHIEQTKSEFEERIQNLRNEKNIRVSDLTQKLELKQENIEICKEKLKQMSDYVQSAKKLLKLKSDDALGKYLKQRPNTNNLDMEEDNLLKSLNDEELDDRQGLFNLLPGNKDNLTFLQNQSKFEQNLKEANDLDFELKRIETEMYKSDVLQLKNEIANLVKDTKLMFKVLDKILPRQEHDAISTLLEFDENKDYMTVEQEIEDFVNDKDDSELSVKQAIKDIRLLRKNIVSLKTKSFEMM